MIDVSLSEILERDPCLAYLVDHVRTLACTLTPGTKAEQFSG